MAIAFDASTQGSAGAAPSSQTYSHTTSGSDRILYVHIYTGASVDTVSGVTYAGVSMTDIGFVGGGWGGATLFRLVNPASGANNVVISYTGTPIFGVSVACSYTGARQSGGTFVSNTANVAFPTTSLTVALSPNSANNWIACVCGNQGSNPFTATNSAFIRRAGSDIAVQALDTNGDVGPSSTTMGITVSGNGGLGLVAESFEPVTAAGPTNLKSLDGNVKANIKSFDGNVIANIKSLDGNS